MRRAFPDHADRASLASRRDEFEPWDSLGHLLFVMEIEAEFARKFTTEQITEARSVDDICRFLDQ